MEIVARLFCALCLQFVKPTLQTKQIKLNNRVFICTIFANPVTLYRQTKTNNQLTPAATDNNGTKTMKAFIDIVTKNHKGGDTFINDEVKNMDDCFAWFDLNMDYLKKVAKRKSIESVTIYVKEQYNVIYSYTI